MKLSEAILLGSVGSEQGFGRVVDGDRACAIGAALLAIGVTQLGLEWNCEDPRQHGSPRLVDNWPWTNSLSRCPHCSTHNTVSYIISWHLNDSHRWTRPQIAAWVAEQEAIYDPPKQEVKEESCDLVKLSS